MPQLIRLDFSDYQGDRFNVIFVADQSSFIIWGLSAIVQGHCHGLASKILAHLLQSQ